MAFVKQNQKETVLITGGMGYLGSVLSERLLRDERYSVIVLDHKPLLKAKENLGYGDLLYVQADIRDVAALEKLFAEIKISYVIHLAGVGEHFPGNRLYAPSEYELVNFVPLVSLLRLSGKFGVKRFLFSSSATVYGKQGIGKKVTELTLPNPPTSYSRYKLLCERELIQKFWPFAVCAVRFAPMCGYSSHMRFDLPHNAFIRDALKNDAVHVFRGRAIRPTTHISDAARLFNVLLEAPIRKVDRMIFNAGYENYSWAEWVRILEEKIKKPLAVMDFPLEDIYSYRLSSLLVERTIGFFPQKKFSDAVDELSLIFLHEKRSSL